ncbi:hypothetical protein D3C85_1452070 [compost metagenome]
MDGAELFGGDYRIAVVEAHAAEFLRLGDTQQAQVAGFLENLVDREAAVLFPLLDMRVDFLVDKVTDCAAQLFVFLGEDHCCAPVGGAGPPRLCAPDQWMWCARRTLRVRI